MRSGAEEVHTSLFFGTRVLGPRAEKRGGTRLETSGWFPSLRDGKILIIGTFFQSYHYTPVRKPSLSSTLLYHQVGRVSERLDPPPAVPGFEVLDG